MGTLTRKQREVQDRERMLLGIARRMLIEHGYAGLNMDRLAEATEYSKGTVYQHFSTKEDLVTALSVESIEHRLLLFDKARRFNGRPREKMLAFGVADELFARLHPHYYRSEQIIRLADLENRVSSGRRETLESQDGCAIRWVVEIVQSGIDLGDLKLSPGQSVGSVVFAVFSLAIGTASVMLTYPHAIENLNIIAPFECLRENMQALFDGFGWRPLRWEWNYAETFQRIAKEVFADEYRRADIG